jgi:O-acetyl-ADP-ribose deacetylase (regulator of RNase III)
MKVNIDKNILEVIKGDISEQETVAVVNAANNYLWMGSGVAGALKKKGGEVIEMEAMAQGPIPIGEAVITTGGKLKAKYVIHAAGMAQDLKTDEEKVRRATLNSLIQAEKSNIESISFPAIGTGVGGFSVHICAQIMLEVVIDFLIESKYIKKVVFVLLDDSVYKIFCDELKKKFSK